MNDWVDEFKPALQKFLKKQGKRITKEIQSHLEKLGFSKFSKDDSNDSNNSDVINMADLVLNSFDQGPWDKALADLLQSMLYNIYIAGMEDAGLELSGAFTVDPVFHQYANDYSEQRTAELAGTGTREDYKLSDSTRAMLRADLIQCMNEGLTPAEIAVNLQDNYAFSEYRSMMIARTETGFSWNSGTIQMYMESGVGLVNVFDGDYDPDCAEADGEIWSVAYAIDHPLQHPNCVRSFAPCLEPDAEADRE